MRWQPIEELNESHRYPKVLFANAEFSTGMGPVYFDVCLCEWHDGEWHFHDSISRILCKASHFCVVEPMFATQYEGRPKELKECEKCNGSRRVQGDYPFEALVECPSCR